jgi:hypothetical protein
LTDSVETLIAISGTVVSPRVTSPAARNRVIRSLSWCATRTSRLRLPREKGTRAAIAPLSLIRKGIPGQRIVLGTIECRWEEPQREAVERPVHALDGVPRRCLQLSGADVAGPDQIA